MQVAAPRAGRRKTGSMQKRKAVEGGRADQVFPPGQVWPPKYPQKLCVKKKKLDKNTRSHFMIPFLSSKCKLIYSDRKQTRGCLGRVGVRLEGGMTRCMGALLEVINILIMMIVSGVYIWVKTYETIHFKYVQFIYSVSVISQ